MLSQLFNACRSNLLSDNKVQVSGTVSFSAISEISVRACLQLV